MSDTLTPLPGGALPIRYRDMGDGTVAEVVSAVVGGAAGIGIQLVDHSGSITVGGTAQALMDANPSRRYLLIENLSSGDLWFDFTATAVASHPSLRLPPAPSGFVMEASAISTEAISIIGATTGQAFSAKDG